MANSRDYDVEAYVLSYVGLDGDPWFGFIGKTDRQGEQRSPSQAICMMIEKHPHLTKSDLKVTGTKRIDYGCLWIV